MMETRNITAEEVKVLSYVWHKAEPMDKRAPGVGGSAWLVVSNMQKPHSTDQLNDKCGCTDIAHLILFKRKILCANHFSKCLLHSHRGTLDILHSRDIRLEHIALLRTEERSSFD